MRIKKGDIVKATMGWKWRGEVIGVKKSRSAYMPNRQLVKVKIKRTENMPDWLEEIQTRYGDQIAMVKPNINWENKNTKVKTKENKKITIKMRKK